MKKTRSRLLLTGAVLLMCTLLACCGCGKKKAVDPETEEVIKISITPEPTPTTAPEQVNSAAVVSSGGVTMVNSYLDGNAGSTSANTTSGAVVVSDNTSTTDNSGSSDNSTSADVNTSSDTENDSYDSGDSQDYSEDDSSQDDSEYDYSQDDSEYDYSEDDYSEEY